MHNVGMETLMELNTLRSFLVISQEENMTVAAAELHVSQSTLSRQMKTLEQELGAPLFIRRSYGLTLTQQGRLLKERATDLITLADKIGDEFADFGKLTGGTLYFGLAESRQITVLARQIAKLRRECPDLHYHVESGVSAQVLEHLDAGVLDFVVLAQPPDTATYESWTFPGTDRWGLIMPEHNQLARRAAIRVDDLAGLPLFCSQQAWNREIAQWAGRRLSSLKLEATFGLAYNASVFVREGLGYYLSFDDLIDTHPGSGLAFRPLDPPLETKLYLAWRKGRQLSPIASRFVAQLRGSDADVGKRG